MRMVVYTAIFGGHHKLNEPVRKFDGIDLVCYTDDSKMISETWDIRLMDSGDSPRRDARRYKHQPSVLFPDYDYSLWVDGNYRIMSDPREMMPYLDDAHMVCFRHPERDCVYDEQLACLEGNRGNPELMWKQITRYREEGYPEHNGLIESGILLRRHNEMNTMSEAWWSEICRESARDQLSFNYVAWKIDFTKWFELARESVDGRHEHDRYIMDKLVFKRTQHFDYHIEGDKAYHAGDLDRAVELWGKGYANGNQQCGKNLEWVSTW